MTRAHMRIEQVRRVGVDAQVLTVVGGGGGYRRRPCEPTDAGDVACPWIVGNAAAWPAEAYIASASTAYDAADHTFGCHQSTPAAPLTCAGFLLRGAEHNLTVRMHVLDGTLDLGQVHDGGQELYSSYRQMAIAGGVDPAHEALRPCRDAGDDHREDPADLLVRLVGADRAAEVLAELAYDAPGAAAPLLDDLGDTVAGEIVEHGSNDMASSSDKDSSAPTPLPTPAAGAAAAGGEIGRKIAEKVSGKGKGK